MDRVPGRLAGPHLGDVALQRRANQGGQSLPCRRLADHDHLPALPVAPTRREARVLEDLPNHRIPDGRLRELAGGEGRSHHFIQVHGVSPIRLGTRGLWVARLRALPHSSGSADPPEQRARACGPPPSAADPLRYAQAARASNLTCGSYGEGGLPLA